jgi:hypothetical protein
MYSIFGKLNLFKPINYYFFYKDLIVRLPRLVIKKEKLKHFKVINYNKWENCDDACSFSEELEVPV